MTAARTGQWSQGCRHLMQVALLGSMAWSCCAQTPLSANASAKVVGYSATQNPVQTDAAARSAERLQAIEQRLSTTGLLLVFDARRGQMLAFDPVTGDLLAAPLFSVDRAVVARPSQLTLSQTSTHFLITDQVSGKVQRFDLDGRVIGSPAAAGFGAVAESDELSAFGPLPTMGPSDLEPPGWAGGYRAVQRLANGDYLAIDASSIHRVAANGMLGERLVSEVSADDITWVAKHGSGSASAIPALSIKGSALLILTLTLLALVSFRRRPGAYPEL